MAFYFNAIVDTSNLTAHTAITVPVSTSDSISLQTASLDQDGLQNAINDAMQTSVNDIADQFGDLHLPGAMGDIFGDAKGELGAPGASDLSGLGGFSDSLGGMAGPDMMNSLQDLMGWAKGMVDPNRVDTGTGGGDPFDQPRHKGGIPDNVHINGSGGEGYTVDGKTGIVTLEAGEEATVTRWGSAKSEHYGKEGQSYKVDQYTMSVDTYTRYEDGSYQITHSSRDTAGNVKHTGTIYDKSGKVVETQTTEQAHKYPPLPVSFDPEGGNGGIDGGSDPVLSGHSTGPTDNFTGNLGQVYVHIGNGSSGGDGEVNSSFEDLVAALGGVMPNNTNAGEGGQGEGADGGTDGSIILPPYYVEHQVNLIGAVIDPIPYII